MRCLRESACPSARFEESPRPEDAPGRSKTWNFFPIFIIYLAREGSHICHSSHFGHLVSVMSSLSFVASKWSGDPESADLVLLSRKQQ